MRLKTIKASHFANYKEAYEANRLLCLGRIQPVLSAPAPLDDVGAATARCCRTGTKARSASGALAPADGLGITDRDFREQVGEDRITLFRRHAQRAEDGSVRAVP